MPSEATESLLFDSLYFSILGLITVRNWIMFCGLSYSTMPTNFMKIVWKNGAVIYENMLAFTASHAIARYNRVKLGSIITQLQAAVCAQCVVLSLSQYAVGCVWTAKSKTAIYFWLSCHSWPISSLFCSDFAVNLAIQSISNLVRPTFLEASLFRS